MKGGLFVFVTIFLLGTQSGRVERAKAIFQQQREYERGCSGFVSEVLEFGWESANDLMGPNPVYVGTNNIYSGLKPGDVVGWKANGSGHVAIYIGEAGIKFIDVQSDGEKPRMVKNGYGKQKLYKSSKY